MFVEHKEVGEVLEAPGKVLKLSEAMRIGAKVRPQCFNDYFMNGRSCALSAAYEGVTGRPATTMEVFSPSAWAVQHFGIPQNVASRVLNLNDKVRMSREGIANWLERKGY